MLTAQAAISAAFFGSVPETENLVATKSRTGPPSKRYTGNPTDFPNMSHSAISRADLVKGLPTMALLIFMVNRPISVGSFPISRGAKIFLM